MYGRGVGHKNIEEPAANGAGEHVLNHIKSEEHR